MIDPEMKLSPHFKLKEFMSPGSDSMPPEVLKNLRMLADVLEMVREKHGNRAIHITSGYRTPTHNAAVGGAPNSYHMRGMAADFVVHGVTPRATQELLKDWRGGLELASTWTHLDLGPKRRFKP